MIGGDLPFRIKQYTSSSNVWKYIGKCVAPRGNVYQFVGTWGLPQQSIADGGCVFSALDQSSCVTPPEPIEGQWLVRFSFDRLSLALIVASLYRIGHYAYNGSAQEHPMELAMSLDHGVPFAPNGPLHIIGNGSDDAGAFDIKGTIGKVDADGLGGQVDFVKSYSGWGWKYQGRYDGRGAIGGTWGDVAGMTMGGSFQLTQVAKPTVELAAPIM